MYLRFPSLILALCLLITLSGVNANEADQDWKDISSYDTTGHDLMTQDGLWAAQIQIGDYFATNSKGSEDLKKSLYWYTLAANSGSPEAMFLIAKYHSFQPDVKPDDSIPLEWLTKAADHGYIPAILEIAEYQINQEKYDVAALWFEKAASNNDLTAIMKLGDLYFTGPIGVKFDKEGKILSHHEIKKDLTKAVALYRRAAERNHSSSQLRLGIAYFQGKGIKKDLTQAFKWVKLSAENGNTTAASYLNSTIMTALTEKQIAQGNNAVSMFLSKSE